MNKYEAVFILTPVLSEEQIKEAVEKFKGILSANGAEIVNEEDWGLKKLAYPIEKKTTGYYRFLEFDAEPTVIDKLEIQFRRDERVLRFLTVRQDKFAAEYAAKRRGIKANAKAAPAVVEEAPAKAEEVAAVVEEAPAVVEEAPVVVEETVVVAEPVAPAPESANAEVAAEVAAEEVVEPKTEEA